MGVKLTFKGKDTADLMQQVSAFVIGSSIDEAREELREQVQTQADAQTLTDAQYDAKYSSSKAPTTLTFPDADQALPPPAQTRGRKKGNGAKTAEAPPAPPAPEPDDEIPTLDALKGAITTFYTQDPKGGKVRAAVDALKPKLSVPFISQCTEEHRAALWEFCQSMGFEVM